MGLSCAGYGEEFCVGRGFTFLSLIRLLHLIEWSLVVLRNTTNQCSPLTPPGRVRNESPKLQDFPGGSDHRPSTYQQADPRSGRPGFNPRGGKISLRRKWQPTLVLLPGKSPGWRSLVAGVHGVAKSQTRLSNFIFTFFQAAGKRGPNLWEGPYRFSSCSKNIYLGEMLPGGSSELSRRK